MQNVTCVQVGHTSQHLHGDPGCLSLVEATGFEQLVKDLPAVQFLEDQVHALFRLVHRFKFHDLWVVYRREHIDLPLQVRKLPGRKRFRLDTLDSACLPSSPTNSLANLAAQAGAEHLPRQGEVVLEPPQVGGANRLVRRTLRHSGASPRGRGAPRRGRPREDLSASCGCDRRGGFAGAVRSRRMVFCDCGGQCVGHHGRMSQRDGCQGVFHNGGGA
mmetsp:Transcript_77563/g.250995  ORF Transcript_77563/g.250995 Transcript_77563/m.250995 type:complete len:217 (-) Transcript_77563:67-717(-)